MIDANLSWRSNFPTADANLPSLGGKNGDFDGGDSGTSAGDIFQSHIQQIVEGQGKTINTAQTAEQSPLPQYVFMGRGSSERDDSATTDSVSKPTRNESLSDDPAGFETFDGLNERNPTIDVALRLAARGSSDVLGNDVSSAADNTKDAKAATGADLSGQSSGVADDRTSLGSMPQSSGAQIAAGDIITDPEKPKDVSAQSSTSEPDGRLDASSGKQSLPQNQATDEIPNPISAITPDSPQDRKTEDTGQGGSASQVSPSTGSASSPAPSRTGKIDASNDSANPPAVEDSSNLSSGLRTPSEILKSRFGRSHEAANTAAPSDMAKADTAGLPAAENLPPAAPTSQNLSSQTPGSSDRKPNDGDLNAASTQASTSISAENLIVGDDENPQDFSRRTEDDKSDSGPRVEQSPRNRDKAVSSVGSSSSAAASSMAAASLSTAPSSDYASAASLSDDGVDGGSVGASTSLDRLSVAPGPLPKHAPTPSIEPDDSASSAAIVVSVVGQSRSLAPPVLTSLMHQVADPIIAAGHAITAAGGNLAPAGDVKTLEIQLVPENLGTVTVKMRLSGDALEVQVEADRQGTLRLLTDSKDALSQSIEASGYKLDAMSMQASSNASSNTFGFDGGQAPQGQPQGHGSGFQSSSQGSGSSPGWSQQGQDRTRDQAHFGGRQSRSGETSDGYAQDNDRDRRSRSIYV